MRPIIIVDEYDNHINNLIFSDKNRDEVKEIIEYIS